MDHSQAQALVERLRAQREETYKLLRSQRDEAQAVVDEIDKMLAEVDPAGARYAPRGRNKGGRPRGAQGANTTGSRAIAWLAQNPGATRQALRNATGIADAEINRLTKTGRCRTEGRPGRYIFFANPQAVTEAAE